MKFTLSAGGAQAAGQGIGNIFKAYMLGPQVRQQAEQEAIKNASYIYYRRMAGDKFGAEAGKLGQESEGLRLTNAARTAPIDATRPAYEQSATRAFQATGDTNMENYAKAIQLMQRVGNVDNVIANPAQAPAVGQAYAATEGKPMFNAVGNTGVSLNQFTGQQSTTSPEMMELFERVQQSIWNKNNAQAGSANAAAGLSGARRDRVVSGLDKPVTIVDDETGQATVTALPTRGDPRTIGVAAPKGTGADATNAKARNAVVAAVEREMGTLATDAEIQAEVDRRMARRGTNKNPAPASGAPKIGTIENGYRFKGGNPASPESWEKMR